MTSQEGSSNSNNSSGNNNGGGDSKPADPFGFEDANKLGSAYRSATFAFVAQYEKQYAQSVADGADAQAAIRQALVAGHNRQSQVFLDYASAAESVSDPRWKAAYSEAAVSAAREASALAGAQGPMSDVLNAYYSESTSKYASLMNASPALRFAAKHGGPVGDLVDIGAATLYGTPGDVAKAVVGAAMGAAAGTIATGVLGFLGITGAPAIAVVAAVAIGVGVLAPDFVPDSEWNKLGDWGKEAIKDVADWFEDAWSDTAKWWGDRFDELGKV